ncbi:MAG: hypothetical protein KC713_03375, partial [Candidatus Omnitrophica bacterium]|nr:hypothetical protein [Candidatus Omnitrophota bacterium]
EITILIERLYRLQDAILDLRERGLSDEEEMMAAKVQNKITNRLKNFGLYRGMDEGYRWHTDDEVDVGLIVNGNDFIEFDAAPPQPTDQKDTILVIEKIIRPAVVAFSPRANNEVIKVLQKAQVTVKWVDPDTKMDTGKKTRLDREGPLYILNLVTAKNMTQNGGQVNTQELNQPNDTQLRETLIWAQQLPQGVVLQHVDGTIFFRDGKFLVPEGRDTFRTFSLWNDQSDDGNLPKNALIEIANMKVLDRGPNYDVDAQIYSNSRPGDQVRFSVVTDEITSATSRWAQALPEGTIIEDVYGDQYVVQKQFLAGKSNPTDMSRLRNPTKREGGVIWEWAPDQRAISLLTRSRIVYEKVHFGGDTLAKSSTVPYSAKLNDTKGGIDLESLPIDIERSGEGVTNAFDNPEAVRALMESSGLEPVIHTIVPMTAPVFHFLIGYSGPPAPTDSGSSQPRQEISLLKAVFDNRPFLPIA